MASQGQPPHGSQPTLRHWVTQGGLQGGPPKGPKRLAFSEPTLSLLLSPDDLMPPLQRHRVSSQPRATGLLMKAGLLCAKLPYIHQRPSGWLLELSGHFGRHCAYSCHCEVDPTQSKNFCREASMVMKYLIYLQDLDFG